MEKIEVIVSSYAAEAKGIVTLELRRADGASLPRFTPGAHIDLFLPNGWFASIRCSMTGATAAVIRSAWRG